MPDKTILNDLNGSELQPYKCLVNEHTICFKNKNQLYC